MKRFVAVLVFLAACSTSAAQQRPTTTVSSNVVGADTPRQAVQQFLAAAHAQDLKAMALVWGTNDGPARDVVESSQLEKRELIMQCYVSHDSYSVLSEVPGEKGARILAVSLTKGQLARQSKFTAVKGRGDRWFVEDVQLEPLKDLCAAS
ncbi:MAG TPA: hypothetical protein VJR24_19715 [Gemmatimonadaceae bacterium]|nr:hypothetical protein [Gemmatimonadaceae bacterium]